MFVFFFKFEVERKVNMYFLLKINMIAINSFFFLCCFSLVSFPERFSPPGDASLIGKYLRVP